MMIKEGQRTLCSLYICHQLEIPVEMDIKIQGCLNYMTFQALSKTLACFKDL